mgnify:CR=1 FL=1
MRMNATIGIAAIVPVGIGHQLRARKVGHLVSGAGLEGSPASGVGGTRRYDTSVVTPFMPEDEKLAAVRAALPATGAGIYLNAGSVGPMPAETQRAMDEQAASELFELD